MSKKIRNVPGDKIQDPNIIDNLEYSNSAGSKKVSEVGRHLIPLKFISGGAVAYTTDASTARRLDKAGACLAVYNSDTTLHAVTVSTASIAALAAGTTDVNGNVGIPCAPGAWTYIACDSALFVITNDATLLVFLIDDESSITIEQK